jgi:hypothetical protein
MILPGAVSKWIRRHWWDRFSGLLIRAHTRCPNLFCRCSNVDEQEEASSPVAVVGPDANQSGVARFQSNVRIRFGCGLISSRLGLVVKKFAK